LAGSRDVCAVSAGACRRGGEGCGRASVGLRAENENENGNGNGSASWSATVRLSVILMVTADANLTSAWTWTLSRTVAASSSTGIWTRIWSGIATDCDFGTCCGRSTSSIRLWEQGCGFCWLSGSPVAALVSTPASRASRVGRWACWSVASMRSYGHGRHRRPYVAWAEAGAHECLLPYRDPT
jgi:hypothetical protein